MSIWLIVAMICGLVVFAGPRILRHRIETPSLWEDFNRDVGLAIALFLVTASIACYAIVEAYTPGQHLLWWIGGGVGVVVLVVYIWAMVRSDTDYSMFAMLAIFVAMVAVIGFTAFKGFDDNSWRLTSGRVVSNDGYSEGYWSGGQYYPESWWIEIKNCYVDPSCPTALKYFDGDPRQDHPVESWYTDPSR